MLIKQARPVLRRSMAIPLGLWAIVTIFGLVPPFSRDALNDHLMLPILWEHYGLFWRDMALSFTAYPPLADLPYMLFSASSWDWMASAVHALGALATLVFLNKAMKNLHVPANSRRVVLLSWIVSPVVVSLATWCYVDLWLCAFAAMAIERLTRSSWQNSDAWIFGLFIGMAMLVKYNAAPLTLALMLSLLWRWGKTPRIASTYASISLTVCLLISGWWYIWNWIVLGTPFYPLGESHSGLTWLQFRIFGYQESFIWAAIAPLRQFFWGEVNNARFFDGMLHPLWLIAFITPVFWRQNKRVTALLIVGLVYITFAMATGVRARYWLPGITVLLPLVGLVLMKAKRVSWNIMTGISFVPPTIASILYLANLAPWQFWLNGRDAFLQQHVPDYAISQWANSHLPHDSQVYLLWNGGRAYYLNKSYGVDFTEEGAKLKDHLKYNDRFEYTHILMQRDLTNRTIGEDFTKEWRAFLENSCQLAKAGAYELWETAPCSNRNGE